MTSEYTINEDIPESPGQVNVVFSGSLGAESSKKFAEDMDALLERGIQILRIDLRELTFCDSPSLGMMIMFNKAARRRTARVDFIVKPQSDVHKLLIQTHADKILPLTISN